MCGSGHRVDDLEIEFQQTQPQLSLTVDRRRTEDLGIPIEGIVNTLRHGRRI